MDNGTITVRQFKVLVFFYTIGTTIMIIPASLAADAKQDAWISALLGLVIGYLFIILYIALGSRMKETSLIDFCRQVLGKVMGNIVGAIFVLFGFVGSSTLLFYVGNFITTQILVETPIQAVHGLFIFIVVLAARCGLETLARTAEILVPWFVGLFLLLCIMLSPEIRTENLQPVLEAEFRSILKGGVIVASTASLPLISFLAIFPSRINKPDKAAGAFVASAWMGGLFIVVISWLTIAVLGASTTERLVFPVYVLAKKVSIGGFIERVEVILATLWFFSIFFKLSIYFHVCLGGLASITKVRDSRKLVFPLGGIVLVYGQVVYPTTAYMTEWDTYTWLPFMCFAGIVLPILLLVVRVLREKA